MARKIWINVSNSFILHTGEFENPPRHFNVSIAAGHVLPLDDFILSNDLALPLESYELVDPDLGRTGLPMPRPSADELITTSSGLTIESGDVAAKKICIHPDTASGTHQVSLATKEILMDIPDDNGNMIRSKIRFFAKSFLTVNQWTQPAPLGHDLELLPMDDLSNVHVGDRVSFQATFFGEPFTCDTGKMEYILAKSNTFGGEAGGDMEGFFLGAYLVNGKARFRMPSAGQWMIVLFNFCDITPDYKYRQFVGDCSRIYYHSTLTFNVKA